MLVILQEKRKPSKHLGMSFTSVTLSLVVQRAQHVLKERPNMRWLAIVYRSLTILNCRRSRNIQKITN